MGNAESQNEAPRTGPEIFLNGTHTSLPLTTLTPLLYNAFSCEILFKYYSPYDLLYKTFSLYPRKHFEHLYMHLISLVRFSLGTLFSHQY